MHIYWGDIHNHNEIGYGKGSIERSFDIAENSLDFYAFTPHTWWPDLPDNDATIKQKHLDGFKKVKVNWNNIMAIALKRHCDGKFVTLLGWEWHSLAWGDYCVYFPEESMKYFYADTLDELKEFASKHDAFIVPHHVAYCLGCRGVNWSEFDEESTPVVEIFSEHGNSLEASTHLGMYSHSMGGVELSQAALNQLRNGKRFGFIANTDDHYGYPAGYGHGITAVIAEKLDRFSIFDAIRKRHTYAATGDRIKIDFNLNEGIMGDFVKAADSAEINFRVEARDRLKSIEIYKNGQLFKLYSPLDFATAKPEKDRHLIKIEWGWDMLSSQNITQWKINLESVNGEISDIVPAFCGGAASVTEKNLLTKVDDSSWLISSYTSRKNANPVNSVSFFLLGSIDAGIKLEIEAQHEEMVFKREIFLDKSSLLDHDVYESVIDRFSSPKIKIHSLISSDEFAFNGNLLDDTAKPGDFYFLKAAQQNGQMAWTSPIWIKKKREPGA